MKHTIHGYKEFLKLCDDLGAAPQITTNLTPATDGNQQVCRHQVTDINDLTQLFSAQLPMVADINEPDSSRMSEISANDRTCGAGNTFLSICPDGTVYPCPCFPLTIGNVREQSAADIWKHSKTLAAWQSVVLNDFDECGMYSECTYCDVCPGKAMLTTNNILGKMETLCHVAKVRRDVNTKVASERGVTIDETFGNDLTFRAPQPVVADVSTQSQAIGSVKHEGSDFVVRMEQIKAHGNPVRKTIVPEPDSLAAKWR